MHRVHRAQGYVDWVLQCTSADLDGHCVCWPPQQAGRWRRISGRRCTPCSTLKTFSGCCSFHGLVGVCLVCCCSVWHGPTQTVLAHAVYSTYIVKSPNVPSECWNNNPCAMADVPAICAGPKGMSSGLSTGALYVKFQILLVN